MEATLSRWARDIIEFMDRTNFLMHMRKSVFDGSDVSALVSLLVAKKA